MNRTLLSSLALCALLTLQAFMIGDTPQKTVEEFKKSVDENDMYAVCQVVTEEDGSGPLKSIRFEQMSRSLESLTSLWRGQPFIYGDVEISTDKKPDQATVKVEVPNLSQEVKFVLLKFGNAWYIFDMEIYFKQ